VLVAPVTLAPAIVPKETGGSPEFPDYPFVHMPRSQTPVGPARLPWRGLDCCLAMHAYRRLWVRSPGLILLTTIIHFSEFNDAACVLAFPRLRTPPLGDRTSVRLPTWWLAFGRVGLESSSHPLGNVDMFQEVSPLSSHPEFSSAREMSRLGEGQAEVFVRGTPSINHGAEIT